LVNKMDGRELKNVSKMVLVPQELVEKFDRSKLRDMDQQMHEILYNATLPDGDKWKLYTDILQKHLLQVQEANKPVSIPIIQNVEEHKLPVLTLNDRNSVYDVNTRLEETLGRQLLVKAKALLTILSRTAELSWNDQGEVVIQNEVLPHSNIAELISNSVKSKQDVRPLGWERFVETVTQIGVPAEFLGRNVDRTYINILGKKTPKKSPKVISIKRVVVKKSPLVSRQWEKFSL
jgi:hypothetical protein